MKNQSFYSETDILELEEESPLINIRQNELGYKDFNYENARIKPYRNKALLDYTLVLLSLPVLILLFPFIYVGIKISSPGPVIFKQKRIGQHGSVFNCYKFRTMHMPNRTPSGEAGRYLKTNGSIGKEKPVITQKNDSRLFRFGRVLRKLNLDEFPQVINVLKQDMSFVGPRPYTIDETNYWDLKFDDFHLRYLMKPGISGYAQVVGLRGGTHDELHMRRRLDYDLIYQNKCSLGFDIKIAFITVLQMLKFKTKAH